jgi:hypothetical protein
MLDFAAERYWKLSAYVTRFSIVPATLLDSNVMAEFTKELGEVHKEASALGLRSSKKQIETIYETLKGGKCTPGDMAPLVAEFGKRMREELEEVWFRRIPAEKQEFASPYWLVGSEIDRPGFNQLVYEFEHAGMCFGIAENGACVFHLMRVVDFCLRKVASSLGIAYDGGSWQAIGNAIDKKMQERYQLKSDEWKKQEPFYAQILTDIQAIGRGHRNPHIHDVESSYSDRDARNMLVIVEGFARHIAEHFSKSGL